MAEMPEIMMTEPNERISDGKKLSTVINESALLHKQKQLINKLDVRKQTFRKRFLENDIVI